MNDTELTQVLAALTVADNRQIDELSLGYWRQMIGDLDRQDCLNAIVMHYRETTAYLMPNHIRENVRRLHLDATIQQDHGTPDQTTCRHKFIGRDRDCVICGLIPTDTEYDTWRELVAS